MMSVGAVSSVFRRGLFRDKVAIVTGGATGIGNAITKELLFLGCNVVIASRKWDQLSKVAEDLNDAFPKTQTLNRVQAVQCNIRKEDEVRNLMSKTLESYGKIDFLVNNGGGQFASAAADINLKGWQAVIETNLTGTFLMCKAAYESWMGEQGGAIVNIITDMFKGWPRMAHSGAARAGVENLTKSLSIEWAEHGIRLNAIAPGSSIHSETAAANYGDPELFQRTIPMIPARRLGKPEEVSGAVCFLLSPAAAFISGATLRIDGAASLYGQSFWTVPDHHRLPAYSWKEDVLALKREENIPKSKL